MNPVDIGVLSIIFGSAVLAFARGFLLEVLSLVGYGGAALVTLFAMPSAQPIVKQYIPGRPLLAEAVTVVVVFVVTLAVFALINHAISDRVRASKLNAVDRSLGFIFGAVRGLVLVSLAFLLLSWIWNEKNRPQMLTDAKTLPALESGADIIRGYIPEIAGDVHDLDVELENKDNKKKSDSDDGPVLIDKPSDSGKRSDGATPSRYSNQQHADLNRLLGTMGQ